MSFEQRGGALVIDVQVVPRAARSILRGETGRRKTVRIEGGSLARLEALRCARDSP
jgi:uncharacterized protein YggU (UPF0235/DUF167 family)